MRTTAFLIFWITFTIWTWLLVEPNPVPERVRELLSIHDLLPFLLAKSLHAGGYAFLAATLAAWVPRRQAPLLLAFTLLCAHGMATEIIQTIVPNRSGRVRDVLIDWFGISCGVAVTFRWWRPLWRGDQKPVS